MTNLQAPEKRSKSSITRKRLLGICLESFSQKGFDQITMRDLAHAAGLSPGAFYYHFSSKEAVIQVFYEITFGDFENRCSEIFSKTFSFEERLMLALHARIDTFMHHRELLIALSRAAVDPRSELSPFGAGTREIRDRTIKVFAAMMDGSDFKFDKRLSKYLPTLLWMYLMGVILFWVFDSTQNQKKSREFISIFTPQMVRLIRFSRFPLTGSVIQPILKTLQLVMPHQDS